MLPLIALAAGAGVGSAALNYLGQQDAIAAQRKANRQASAAQEKAYWDVYGMQQPYARQGIAALGQIEGMQDVAAPADFAFDGNVQQYLDPSMQFQQQQMARQVAASAAARGNLLSGGAAKELQNRAAQLAQTDYGNAYNRMASDRNFAYQQYQNKFTMARQANADRLSRLQTMLSSGQNATNNISNARMGYGSEQSNSALNMGALGAQSAMGLSNAVNQGINTGAQVFGMSQGMGAFGGGQQQGYAPQQQQFGTASPYWQNQSFARQPSAGYPAPDMFVG